MFNKFRELFKIPKDRDQRKLKADLYNTNIKIDTPLKDKKVAVVMSTGGIKQASGVGLFKVLEELDIITIATAGSSGGSLTTSMYASGMSVQDMIKAYTTVQPKDFIDPNLFRFLKGLYNGLANWSGLYDGIKYLEWLNNLFNKKTFNDCICKHFVNAWNVDKNKNEIFCKENNIPLATAIRASGSIPFIFECPQIGEDRYTDGGVSKTLPVTNLIYNLSEQELQEIDLVIMWNASSIKAHADEDWYSKALAPFGMLDTFKDGLMEELITTDIEKTKSVFSKYNIDVILLQPSCSADIKETEKIPDIIEAGYAEAKKELLKYAQTRK